MPDVRLIDANVLPNYKFQTTITIGEKKIPAELRIVFWHDIENAKTIDAEPVVHAGLKEKGIDEAWCIWGECTNCGHSNMISSKYCNECGAKLEVIV